MLCKLVLVLQSHPIIVPGQSYCNKAVYYIINNTYFCSESIFAIFIGVCELNIINYLTIPIIQ